MKTAALTMLAACLLAIPSAGHGATRDPDAGQAWLRASIVLDASGKLTSIEWLGTQPNDRLVTKRLESVVSGWEFEPGKLDGVPAITQTGLTLHVKLQKTAEGGLALNIDDAATGVISRLPSPPSLPSSQARLGVSAHVVLILETDVDGKVASALVEEYESSSTSSTSRKEFEAAAMKAVKSWVYVPEKVGGTGVSARIRVPIDFCVDSWCSKRQLRLAASGKPVEVSGMSLALDSAAKIVKRTSRVEI
jgi:TonB family protein